MQVNAVLAIAHRDLLKLLRDRARIIGMVIFPVLLIVSLGSSLQSNLGMDLGFDFMTFTFTGILAQTLFMSSAQGIISLIEDRENDFSQEMFISPISRYAIVFGKILGESLVALPQGAALLLFGLVIGVSYSASQLLMLALAAIVVCLFGGAFGLIVLSNLPSQRAANQIFPLIILPQWLLAGVFNPIRVLPFYLDILSRISPLRYAVDLVRGVFYAGQPEYPHAVLASTAFNLSVITILFAVFLVAGTFLFVRSERNR